jgi:dGTP triphosphohydrolase
MSLDDAKIVLNGLMRSEISDSLIKAYEIKDSISMNTIKLQDIENTLLKAKSSNQEKIIENYAKIIENKDDELNISKYIVQQQKKEIRKQKIIKKISLVGNVVLPVVTLFTIIGLK